MSLKAPLYFKQSGCTLGEDMLDTMCIDKSRTLVMILHGMLSSISLKLELSVSQSRYNALTKLMSCEELVKNW